MHQLSVAAGGVQVLQLTQVGGKLCAQLILLVIVTTDILKFSTELICTPFCEFIFLLNTNIWIYFFFGSFF